MNLNDKYVDVTSKIDKIFESYITLHEIFSSTFQSLKSELTDATPYHEGQIERRIEIFETTSKGVAKEQQKISSQLYSQGLILLTGSAESLIREFFKNLVVLNPNCITESRAKEIKLSYEQIRSSVKVSDKYWLGKLLYSELLAGKNPESKLNFQNVQQMQNIFKEYLGIEIQNSNLTINLHRYWMIRHILIHNSGVIDERFINNLEKAGIDVSSYKLGDEVTVTKDDYEECKNLYSELFKMLSFKIEESDLIVDEKLEEKFIEWSNWI